VWSLQSGARLPAKIFARLLLSAYGIHPSDVGVSEIGDETAQELLARMAEKYALKALPN